MARIKVTINGDEYIRDVADHRNLLHFLRDDMDLTGTKEGCSVGECGACTVILNGKIVNSCLILAAEAHNGKIETIEGESKNGKITKVQKAMQKHHGAQCGFCTPGIILAVKDLLRTQPKPNKAQIQHAIEGNFCRCTGYQQIIEAVLDATGQLKKKGELDHV